MKRIWWTLAMLLLAGISLLANKALAEDHGHKGWEARQGQHDHGDWRAHRGHERPAGMRDRDYDRFRDRHHYYREHHHRHHGWDRDREWDRHHGWDRDRSNTPPGWQNGKKVGWRGGDLPPGQARKGD